MTENNKVRGMKIIRKIRRGFERHRIFQEISEDRSFLDRQGIKNGELDKMRKGLRYVLVNSFGGVLGYLPHTIDLTPSCLYFGISDKNK